ncbi:MAG TPA: CinA family nicotinamide mononucleotide deamidase-related protein [Candidatus Eisenbacteria bacterium]|nr:CinA family nicotinamide mononucleotide deamidase-related protein [Candidatus Eisenbacteria bacterium]
MANAEIVAIGSELLLGQIVDTNSAWIAQRLSALGVDLFFKSVVGDNPVRMKDVIARALERADVVITSGGLGPTQDDLTREIVAEVTGRRLVLDSELLDQVEAHFRRRGRTMTPNNRRQAYIPEGAIAVKNPNGTAPAFIVEDARAVVFCLPGVPVELKWLFEHEVEPYLRRKFNLAEVIHYRVVKIVGVGESAVDDRIGHLIATSSNPTVGVLAHPGQVDVRIAAKAADKNEALKLIAPLEAEVRAVFGRAVFGIDDETIEQVVGRLLRERNKTVAVYEDVTCGQLADRLQSGAGDRFVAGFIVNTEEALNGILVDDRESRRGRDPTADPELLTRCLAESVRVRSGASYGLALHGIPDVASRLENMAQGQTVIALTDGQTTVERTAPTAGRGSYDRIRMTVNALDALRQALLEAAP